MTWVSGTGGVAERGFAEAVDRLRAWIERGDYQDPVAFSGAVDHLYRIEEAERIRLGDTAYFAHRDTHPKGAVVAGMVYARGLNVHKVALVAEIEGSRPFTTRGSGLRGGDTLRGPGVRLVWRPLNQLPPPTKPERHQRDVKYDQYVADRDVLDTFDDAELFFASVKALP